MNFDPNALLASLAIGLVGMAIFVYGKKQSRLPHMVAGIGLTVFPYFVTNLWVMGGVAVALVGGLWLVVRLGW